MLFDKMIITTSEFPYKKYYNYYLMDWSIERQSKMIYNQEINEFVFMNKDRSVDIDMETKLELDEIKKKIIKKDRILFFK